MEKPSLTLALRDKKWVSIAMVPSGVACACSCPACGAALSAKKGKKNRHHFAHWGSPECPGAFESALHAFTKAVIANADTLKVPAVQAYKNKQALRRPAQLKVVKGEQEVAFGRLRLDVHLTTNKGPLAVEIRVSHSVGLSKQKQLGYLQLPCLEIDAWGLYQTLAQEEKINWQQYQYHLINDLDGKHWLFHPWQHKWEYKQRKEAVQRKVHHQVQNAYHHYLVYGCPKRERFIRSGFREGVSYARVFQNCLHCPNNLGIHYQEVWAGYRMVPEIPQWVYCTGSNEQE